MPVFKYTVANKQGKYLSGSVEAPDSESAKKELNNLGFSVIELSESNEESLPETSDKKFFFEAIDRNSKNISGTIPGDTQQEAFQRLKDEYDLTVTAIWPEGASEEEIQLARSEGIKKLSQIVQTDDSDEQNEVTKSPEELRREKIIRDKIDFILKKVYELLEKFGDKIDAEKRADIEKKIDKLLRIKGSTNLDYVLVTAQEILRSIQNQESSLHEKGMESQRIALQLRTKELLGELKKTGDPKSLSEDIVNRINEWQIKHEDQPEKQNSFIGDILLRIKNYFSTPIEIQTIKDQISNYNSQLLEFAKLYFTGKNKEYRDKVWHSIKTVYKARKKAKNSLKQLKELRRQKRKQQREEHKGLIESLLEELASFTGWLLFFYILYYFTSIYLTTKDFGLDSIPSGFYIYDSQIFKYLVAILFALHSTLALKINFFRKNFIASLVLIPVFFFTSIIILLNF